MALIRRFCTARIPAKVERNKLLAGNVARCVVWKANQLFDLASGHAYLQFGEWRTGSGEDVGFWGDSSDRCRGSARRRCRCYGPGCWSGRCGWIFLGGAAEQPRGKARNR
ncbi:protein of unknown function [Acidithiobacillus ferrivorans]|uniref:Transposase n=1 Tax=Acidithiobacillus ferrivorans TaxID=160808 RepID=A0ABY1MT23_9PROT|nr:protein of unknown function [Acidithiobacillus ferrivorans]